MPAKDKNRMFGSDEDRQVSTKSTITFYWFPLVISVIASALLTAFLNVVF